MLGPRPHHGPALDQHVAAEAHGGLEAHPHVGRVPEEDGAVVRRVGKQLLLGRGRIPDFPVLSKCPDISHELKIETENTSLRGLVHMMSAKFSNF